MGMDVKICGMTNRDDALAALEYGADYLGFILYAESPRGITARKLFEILDRAEEIRCGVGVFVNAARGDIDSIVADCGLCAVQLHGEEDAAGFGNMPVPLWRSVRLREGSCIPAPEDWDAERYLVDADVPGQYGGTGELADWDAAARFAGEQRVMLSGGLTPDNVVEAIETVAPMGVDVASGVEAGPGKKDWKKMRAFIEKARGADAARGA